MTGPQPLILRDHDPEWSACFAREAAAVRAALGDLVITIEHIGSTSVPGLVAKPVIDLLVGVQCVPLPAPAIAAMVDLGFDSHGEYGIPDRSYFSRVDVHAHCFEIGKGQWDSHLLFRDYLRSVPAAREAYAAAKYELYHAGGGDREYYLANKEFVVDAMLEDARQWNAAGRASTSAASRSEQG